jgi:hypothetical protein
MLLLYHLCRIARCAGVDVAQEGLYSVPRIKILSGDPHSSIFKAASMLGMGRTSVMVNNFTHPCWVLDRKGYWISYEFLFAIPEGELPELSNHSRRS